MALPSFHISEIPDEGLRLSCEVSAEELALEPEDARVGSLLSLALEIDKIGRGFHVAGVLAGTFFRQCVRCLKDFEDEVVLPFAVRYRRRGAAPRRASHAAGATPLQEAPVLPDWLDPDAPDDVYQFVGDRIEFADMLREQVILATPMQPLCTEACLGLCQVCGQDRNERRCGCPEQRGDNPFMTLRELRDKLGRT